MKRALTAVVLAVFGVAAMGWADEAAAPKADQGAPAKQGACCATMSAKTDAPAAGMSKCEAAGKKCLAIKDGVAYCCECKPECKCEMKDGKCSCGKDVAKTSLKGMYVCGCGPDCKCNFVSDKEGKCKCGHDLKKVE